MHKTYHMKWPDQLSQVKEKAQHKNVSQQSKKHVRKKSCITVSESIEHHQGSHHSEMFSVCDLEKINISNKASIFASYMKTLSTN